MSALEVLAPGPFASTQDLGRVGLAHLGVPRSGAADRGSLRRANRLVGNPEDAPAVEATLGGLRLRAHGPVTVALTGAPADARRNGRDAGHDAVVHLADGDELSLGTPRVGLRTYVAVRGGLAAARVLGSSATDVLSGLGPPPLRAGDLLPVGAVTGPWPATGLAPVARPVAGEVVTLPVTEGPRADHLAAPARAALTAVVWTVTAQSNRVGVRLDGPPLQWADRGELPSEGVVLGAVQVPPHGRPIVFLADHPVTGGYPVVAVVTAEGVDAAAQAAPGTAVRFVAARPG